MYKYMQTQELTPEQIADYSKTIAEYMGETTAVLTDGAIAIKGGKWNNYEPCRYSRCKYHSDRNWQHEVWEKVRDSKIDRTDDFRTILNMIRYGLCYGSLQDTFISLKNAIDFINSLKK